MLSREREKRIAEQMREKKVKDKNFLKKRKDQKLKNCQKYLRDNSVSRLSNRSLVRNFALFQYILGYICDVIIH